LTGYRPVSRPIRIPLIYLKFWPAIRDGLPQRGTRQRKAGVL